MHKQTTCVEHCDVTVRGRLGMRTQAKLSVPKFALDAATVGVTIAVAPAVSWKRVVTGVLLEP